ncbi:MAG: anthranilate phosphoribosyltransferase [Acidobacteria bacterium]|nr:MAG: anthranilate phosphoribosyltransferase [Acidobacteriota bacterium]
MQTGIASLSAAPTLGELLPVLLGGSELTRSEAAQLVNAMLSSDAPDAQIAAVLALLVNKGESSDELAGFADALYQHALPISIPGEVLDTAGTGASPAKTFNVSSAASFVIAAAGCAIAKHGGRAATSRSGSADVLTALGVRIDCEPETAIRCLRELGICFLFAPKYHPALARVAPIRKALGIRTTFNLVGPMVNPCGAKYRLLGVADEARMNDVAGALAQLGVARAWVLRGNDGLDEITTACSSRVLDVHDGRTCELSVSPTDFGISMRPTDTARAGSVDENAATVRAVLSGARHDVARDLVVLNAAAALHVRTGDGLRECAERAQKAIDDGAAFKKLEALITMSHSTEGAAR